MQFDKNQSIFPSNFHKDVWWWALGLVPPSESLTETVKNQCSDNVLLGCYQWYDYFNELCEDMYIHAEQYSKASARQYRDILEHIAIGEIKGDMIVWNKDEWELYCNKLNKSKAYLTAGIKAGHCIEVLGRTGLKCKYDGAAVRFINEKYPKIFYAMNTFEHSPEIRKTPARYHFANCEFRQLFKSYSDNYDGLLRKLSDDSLYIVHAIHDFAKSLKIQRYIHYDIIKYKYKGIRVLDFSIRGDEYPTLRVNIGTCAAPGTETDFLHEGFYEKLLTAGQHIQKIFINHLEKCDDIAHDHQILLIDGKNEQVCPYMKIKINPLKEDLTAVLFFIAARKASIDKLG